MLMHQPFNFGSEPKRDFTGSSLILFILLSIFSMVASLDSTARDEAAAKIVATLQVATTGSPEDDDEREPVAILPSYERLQQIILLSHSKAPQFVWLERLRFERAFEPRGPPQQLAFGLRSKTHPQREV